MAVVTVGTGMMLPPMKRMVKIMIMIVLLLRLPEPLVLVEHVLCARL